MNIIKSQEDVNKAVRSGNFSRLSGPDLEKAVTAYNDTVMKFGRFTECNQPPASIDLVFDCTPLLDGNTVFYFWPNHSYMFPAKLGVQISPVNGRDLVYRYPNNIIMPGYTDQAWSGGGTITYPAYDPGGIVFGQDGLQLWGSKAAAWSLVNKSYIITGAEARYTFGTLTDNGNTNNNDFTNFPINLSFIQTDLLGNMVNNKPVSLYQDAGANGSGWYDVIGNSTYLIGAIAFTSKPFKTMLSSQTSIAMTVPSGFQLDDSNNRGTVTLRLHVEREASVLENWF